MGLNWDCGWSLVGGVMGVGGGKNIGNVFKNDF